MLGPAVLLAVVAALPAVWSWVENHRYFGLQQALVEGHGRLTREEILDIAGIKLGVSSWRIDAAETERRLERHTWIRRANVIVELPNRIHISVNERRPMAIVRSDELYYVDRRGHVLGRLGPEDSRDFPFITGLENEPLDRRARIILPRVAQLLRWCGRRKCFESVSEVRVDGERMMTVFPVEPAVEILLGWGQWNAKMERLQRIWDAYRGSESQLAMIDLSYPKFVVVKLKAESPPTASAAPRTAT